MRLFLKYVREKRHSVALFPALALLLIASFLLYRLPLAAALYPLALCFGVALVVLILDFVKVRKRHEALLSIQNALPMLTDADALPASDGILDADHQALIRALIEREQRRAEEAELKYGAMIDYYTVWAHQMKTPIAAMRLTLQNEDSDVARKLKNDLNRVESYADMVMAYLRLNADSTDYVIRECNLDEIVRPSVKKFAGDFIAKKLRLTYVPLNCTVLTDEKWLSFVVEQILSNAVKYTSVGGVAIDLEAPKTLRIRDTGMGIAAEDLPRVFENGFTGFNGRADKRASGIGLYLCKRVCDQLGHRIGVESEAGVGTVVRIDLNAKRINVE